MTINDAVLAMAGTMALILALLTWLFLASRRRAVYFASCRRADRVLI